MSVYTREDLKIMQAWPLERKIQVTQTRILEWYYHRYQRMALTHLKQHNFCVNKLGCGKVLDYIGVPYMP